MYELSEITLLQTRLVCQKLNYSKSSVERMVTAGLFPPPVKMGGKNIGFINKEIDIILALTMRGTTKKELRETVDKILEHRKALYEKSIIKAEKVILEKPILKEVTLEDKIEVLNLSTRSYLRLMCYEVKLVKQLVFCTESELLDFVGLGKISVGEIKAALDKHGLKLKSE